MFGLGWSEMILLGIVALIVIGPKDLPNMFRTLGQMTGKAKAMASEFSRAMESAADDSGIGDISKTIKAAANPQKLGLEKAREAAGLTGTSKTPALSAERQAAKDKIGASTAKAAEDRKAREAAAAEAEDDLAMVELPDQKPVAPPVAKAKAQPKTSAKPKAPAKPKTATQAKAPVAAKASPKSPAKVKAKPTALKGDA